MIYVLNNLHDKNDVFTNGLKNNLTFIGDNESTIELLWEKLNHWYEKIKDENEAKKEKENPWEPIVINIMECPISVVSRVTSY